MTEGRGGRRLLITRYERTLLYIWFPAVFSLSRRCRSLQHSSTTRKAVCSHITITRLGPCIPYTVPYALCIMLYRQVVHGPGQIATYDW
jgi:hypothetical protein